MKPTKPGEWWWCELKGWDERVATRIRPERVEGEGLTFVPGGTMYWLVEDTDVRWLGPVAPFATSPDPAAPDASDEVRLAAGWLQDIQCLQDGWSAPPQDERSAPGPAGMWRLHASGVWVRWVVPS